MSETAHGYGYLPFRILPAAVVVLAFFFAGCGQSVGPAAGPTAAATAVSPSGTPDPSVADGTDLTIVYEDGSGKAKRWQLACDPAGGTHPDPQAACDILAAHGERALPPVPKDVACTQVYGGPAKATVTGTWQGKPVRSTFSRVNGCEISRWDQMKGLLPPGGV